MTPSSLHRLALAGMVAFLLGAAACAETPEPAQDDSIEATRTRANAGGGALTDENFFTAVALWFSDEGTATSTYGHISNWEVSAVTDMANAFSGQSSFNGDLSLWDVSSVTNMNSMFRGAESFNGDLSLWDVSSVTAMVDMFMDADAFNGDLSSWDVSSVTNMSYMFYVATSFNQNLSGWCVSLITSKPTAFDTGATSWVLARPIWGTCPS